MMALPQSVEAQVGDPQLRTDHPWYPGELAISTFDRLFEFQDEVYERETGRAVASDEDAALASWYFRNLNYFHSWSPFEFHYGQSPSELREQADSQWVESVVREYWIGLFAYGFGLCGTTHAQFAAEMQYRLGHGRGRVVEAAGGHNTFEAYLTDPQYGGGEWAMLDHDLSTVVFDDPLEPTRLLSIWDIVYTSTPPDRVLRDPDERESMLENVGAGEPPYPNRGWFISGLFFQGETLDDAEWSDANMSYQEVGHVALHAGYAGAPPIVSLRRGESLRRYLAPGLGGERYLFWGPDTNDDGLPGPSRGATWVSQPERMFRASEDAPWRGENGQMGNGVYTYRPDFRVGSYRDGISSESESHVTFYFYSPYVIAGTTGDRLGGEDDWLWDVIDLGSTGGLVVASAPSPVTVQLSTDNETTWSEPYALGGSVDLTDLAKGHHSYHLRFGGGAADLSDLDLAVTTVVQLNRSTVPHLRDDGARVTYEASGRAIFAAGPNLDQAEAFLVDGALETDEVTLEVPAPGGARILQVHAAALVWAAHPPPEEDRYQIEVSGDGGASWTPMFDPPWQVEAVGYQTDPVWSFSYVYGELDVSSFDMSEAMVRFSNDGGVRFRTVEVYLVYDTGRTAETSVTFAWTDETGEREESRVYDAGTGRDGSWQIATVGRTTTRWVEMAVAADAEGVSRPEPGDGGIDPVDGGVGPGDGGQGADDQAGLGSSCACRAASGQHTALPGVAALLAGVALGRRWLRRRER